MWVAEETYRRKFFGVQLMSDNAIEALNEAKCTDRVDTGYQTYNYNILSNPSYQESFHYLSSKFRYSNGETEGKKDYVT